MISAQCPHCSALGCVYTGTCFWCPRCHRTHSQGWAQRQHPGFTGPGRSSEALARPRPPLRTASLSQALFQCPECGERVRPWAITCVRCGYVLGNTRVS